MALTRLWGFKSPRPHFWFIVLLLGSTGCRRDGPVEVFDRFATAWEAGQIDEAALWLTDDSRVLFDGMRAVAGPSASVFGPAGRTHSIRAMGFEDRGGIALVQVRAEAPGDERGTVILREEHGAWRVDLVGTELLWSRDWSTSGGPAERSRPGQDEPGPKPALPELEPQPRVDAHETSR